jgi:hypothetical protein
MYIGEDEVPSECAHHMEQKQICSPESVVEKIGRFIGAAGASQDVIFDKGKKKYNCSHESCVLIKVAEATGDKTIRHVLDTFFKPNGPADTHDWLSNINIDEVLDQIAKKHKDFLHIPFQMRDFAEIQPNPGQIERMKRAMSSDELEQALMRNLSTVDLAKKYKQGYLRYGVVFNTDTSKGPGQHWFCLYGDMSTTPMTLEYFNSTGEPPLDEIRIWMDTTRHHLTKKLGRPTEVVDQVRRHQTDGHSCGPYALYYIMSRLEGVPARVFQTEIIPDEIMHRFRPHLFRREV